MNEDVMPVIAEFAAGFTWVDFAIVVVIALSALLSLFRGFLREALSLLGWIAAVWLAFTFSDRVALMLEDQILVPSLRQAGAFALIFVLTLIATAIFNALVGRLLDGSGISGTDRTIGLLFGAARGAIIVAVLVLVAGLTTLPRDPWWRQSMLVPHFERAALEVRDLLPQEIAGRIRY